MQTAPGSQQSAAVAQWFPAALQPVLVDWHTGAAASPAVLQ